MKQLFGVALFGMLLFGAFLYTLDRITKPISDDMKQNQTLYILDESQIDEAKNSVMHYLKAIENDIKINLNQSVRYQPPRECKIGKNPRFCRISYREYIYVGVIDHYPSEGTIKLNKKGKVVGGHIKIYRFSFRINPDGTLSRE